MSAIDELRRMLDERGVAHSDHYYGTTWRGERGVLHLASGMMTDGSLVVDMLTPEQAIAATLGSSTLTAEQVREAIFNGSAYASYDGAKYYADGINMQAIADELNTRAERTCRDDGDPCDFCCSECGVRMFTDVNDTYTMIANDEQTIIKHPNYCPNCGARVIKSDQYL